MSKAEPDQSSGIGRRRESAKRERSPAWLERRDEVLTAAAEVFRRKGFSGTSVTDIATHLGVNQSNVYYYFGKKEEIFLTLVQQAVEYNVAEAEAAAASKASAVDRLERVVVSLADSYDRHYPFMHLYVQEDVRRLATPGSEADTYLKECARRYEAAVRKIASQGIRSGEFKPDLDAGMLTRAVLGSVNWMHRWFEPGHGETGEEVGREFSRMMLGGLAAEKRQ